jgi:hypothetical protein
MVHSTVSINTFLSGLSQLFLQISQLDIYDHEPLHTIVSLSDTKPKDFEVFLLDPG